MASSAQQVNFRLTDEELKQVEGALPVGEALGAFCKRLALECVRGRRVLRPEPMAGRGLSSADARAKVRPIPKGSGR